MSAISVASLYELADEAGKAAAAKRVPVPMLVGDAKSMLSDEIDLSKSIYVVSAGVCGFAWVNVKPANSAFAKYLKGLGVARSDSYYGGVSVWVSDYNQSMELKEAYAYAFAEVLNSFGIRAYAGSRMD